MDYVKITGGITAPKGFKASGIAAGLKPSGNPDLALIVSDVEAIAAGVFTTSQVRAACVDYCRQNCNKKPLPKPSFVMQAKLMQELGNKVGKMP